MSDETAGAVLNEIDRYMLQSMATSLRAGMGFSFNGADMADLLRRILSALAPGARMVTAEQLREWADAFADYIEWHTDGDADFAQKERRVVAAMRQIAGEPE